MSNLVHGVDLVDIPRLAALLERHGDRFTHRCFTDGERAYADGGVRRRVERYAARFAAKEAVFKALGTGWSGGMGWREVEVIRSPTGRPYLYLTGKCAEKAGELGISSWELSMSHAGSQAMASVIGCGSFGG